jgi:hypothetical protein
VHGEHERSSLRVGICAGVPIRRVQSCRSITPAKKMR